MAPEKDPLNRNFDRRSRQACFGGAKHLLERLTERACEAGRRTSRGLCCHEVTPVGETTNQDSDARGFKKGRLTDDERKLMVAFR
jgi:hypothetical protein